MKLVVMKQTVRRRYCSHSGLNLAVSAGQVKASQSGRRNLHYYFIKPGYQFHYFNQGLTAFSVDYGRYYNIAQNKDRASAYDIDLVQNIDTLHLAVYGGYKQFKLQRPGSNFHNLSLFILGAIYKF